MPFALTLQADLIAQVPLPLPLLIALSVVQSSILFFVVTLLGLWFAEKVSLGAPVLQAWTEGKETKRILQSIIGLSIGLGVLAAVIIIASDFLLSFLGAYDLTGLTTTTPAPWQGFLASFYGGINEEILMRLFVMSLMVWVLQKIRRPFEGRQSTKVMWLSILSSALLFGLGHLPITASLVDITLAIIARAVILNGVAGVTFGWLYWRKGLESAMIAHFSADITLYVVLPLILGLA